MNVAAVLQLKNTQEEVVVACGGALHAEGVWARRADVPSLSSSPSSDYAFLLEALVDQATLHRAEALAKKWGVLPHAVMIANGSLAAADYYRALARECGVPFRREIRARDIAAPMGLKSPHHLQLPIPLAGTSNHFRVSALKWLMAWDPFNVTEDADLGTRLARNRYRCRMLRSTTLEEAPPRLSSWFRQRTRWLKGYMQTWLVHMRDPFKLWRELGPSGFLGFHVMVGGTVLSALAHPWFYGLAAFDLMNGAFLARPAGPLGLPFWLVASLGLRLGYLASMTLGFLALRRYGARELFAEVRSCLCTGC